MLAVIPRLQHRGVGFALKLAQRAVCLEHGIAEIRWTYDPLVARNTRSSPPHGAKPAPRPSSAASTTAWWPPGSIPRWDTSSDLRRRGERGSAVRGTLGAHPGGGAPRGGPSPSTPFPDELRPGDGE